MRKEIITCDRCKKDATEEFMIAGKKDLCANCYHKFLELDAWFEEELEKWLDGKESALDNV